MSLKSQAKRVVRQQWSNPNDLAQEIFRVLASQKIDDQLLGSINLGPTITERNPSGIVAVGLFSISLLTAPLPTISAGADSAVLVFQHVNSNPSIAPLSNCLFQFDVILDGVATACPTVIQGISGQALPPTTDSLKIFPVRKGIHTIDWQGRNISGTVDALDVQTDSRLILLVLNLANADLVTKL